MANVPSTTSVTPKIWLITGVSAGSLGHFISLSALSRNDLVIGTSRSPETGISPVLLSHPNFTPFALDLFSDESALASTIRSIISLHGHIDYVVHTAGGGLVGALEEITTKQLQDHFHLNVFSQVAITRMILPYMRKRGSGVICFVGSIAGWPQSTGGTGWGAYCAGKTALVAIAKTLREEVKPFGITVTLCEPGYFRTPILNSSSNAKGLVLAELRGTIEDYKDRMDKFYDIVKAVDGNQPGNPEKGGERIVQVLKMERDAWKKEEGAEEDLPGRFGVGDDFVPWVESFLNEEAQNLKRWGPLSQGVSY